MNDDVEPRQAHPFEFRLSEAEYRLMERAAREWNLSVTDFILDAALEKAIAITEEDVSSHLATVTSDELVPEAEARLLKSAILMASPPNKSSLA